MFESPLASPERRLEAKQNPRRTSEEGRQGLLADGWFEARGSLGVAPRIHGKDQSAGFTIPQGTILSIHRQLYTRRRLRLASRAATRSAGVSYEMVRAGCELPSRSRWNDLSTGLCQPR